MDMSKSLSDFFYAIETDPRISATHICVYVALLEFWHRGRSSPIKIFSYQLMKLAKISSGKTYFKCINELSQYGYIHYEPSFNNKRPSNVYLKAINVGTRKTC